MAQYATLKAAINAVIKANGQKEITGTVLNEVLTSMVNSLGANYMLAGVATPSTNPGTPDQNVFYLAFEAGTYTNFNATVLPAGISILMWNGSWSSQTFYTIDATPTASSNNLVSSGAVFDAIKTDGSAYDVSAHFPTGGPNSDGKFTLDYILANANTLIPTAWRKGGMSIRFVSSSDNKYVQCRYMGTSTANADFINVANWQVVDDEPIAGSKNLVESGGVALSLGHCKLANGTYNNAGNQNFIRTEFIAASGATIVGIETNRPNRTGCEYRYAYCLTSSYNDVGTTSDSPHMDGKIVAKDVSFIDAWKSNAYDISDYSATVGVGFVIAEYETATGIVNALRVSDFIGYSVKIIASKSLQAMLDNKVDPVSVIASENNLLLGIRLRSTDMKQGNIANNNTSVTPSEYQIYKDYTPIDPTICNIIKFLGNGVNTYTLRLNFYNSAKQPIYGSGVYSHINNIAVPSNAAFFRLGFDNAGSTISPSDIDSIKFYIKYINISDYFNSEINNLKSDLPINQFLSLFSVTIPNWRYQGEQQKVLIMKGVNLRVRFKNVLTSSASFAARLRNSAGDTLVDSGWITVSANAYFDYILETDYVDEDTYLYVTCGSNSTATTTVEISYKDGIYSLSQHGNESENLINQIGRDPRTGQTITGNTLVLAHFSDIHGSKKNLQYIVNFCSKYSSNIDDILQTGDLQQNYWDSGISFFTGTLGAEKILNVIGNHDAWAGSSFGPDLESKVNVYNRFIAPFISNWGTIVQPTDAATNGLNYYYKDYSNEKIRLIVLDCMYWDSAENTWLQSVLADAKINNLSVICASHYTPGALTHFDCSFDDSIWSALEQPYLNTEASASVQSFIDNGGEFITWLCGHTHKDYIGTLSNYQSQLVIIIDTAGHGVQTNSGMINRVVATQSEYLFNILGFDTVNKVVRLFRVGANRDCFMRAKDTLCIKYTTKQLIK